MFRTVLTLRATPQRLSLPLFFGLFCALLLLLLPTKSAYAESQPGGNVSDPVVRAVDIARPSVVRIYTFMDSHLTVHFSNGDVTFPQDSSKAYTLAVSGSGTFISANGDILTADHVVNPPKDASLDQFLHQTAAPDVTSYINQNSKALGLGQMDQSQVQQELDGDQLRSASSYDTPKSEVYLSTDYTGPLTATDMNLVPTNIHASVDKIEAESAADVKDVAIVHANFIDTPAVSLGDSSSVQVQDALKIIGFPGNGDINSIPSNLLTSSISDINVSSIKTTTTGATVIQVSGNVEHGDSGGPALDASGNVVGIVSFSEVVANGGSTGGTSFLQASNSANDLLKPLNLDLTPGTFQKLWSQAFNSYAASTPGHWHAAQQQFEQIATQYPNFKALQPYLDYAKTQALTESTVQSTPTAKSTTTPSVPVAAAPSNMTALALTIGAIGLLVVLTVLVLVVNIRGRKKTNKMQSPASASSPMVGVSGGSVGENKSDASSSAAQRSSQIPPVGSTSSTLTLRAWPCGHLNRSNASFCSVCGEPAPPPPTIIRRIQP
jgi:Trypsin-like peptidase domain